MPRHLAVGDIHGCITALRTLVEYVELREDDILIPLGDYCDRGPDTYAVIDYLIHLSSKFVVHPLRGNHEIMMLNALEEEGLLENWLKAGGRETLQSYSMDESVPGVLADVPEVHWDWLKTKLMAFFEASNHFFVHANVFADVPLDEQPDFMLYWEPLNSPPKHCSGKTMVCGHSSQKSGWPLVSEHTICIDTWAYGKGWLSCLAVETGTVWQANEQGDTRRFNLDQLPL